MSWSITTQDMARIRTFSAAERHWKDTPAWKIRPSSWRALGVRRADHKRVEQLEDGSYACVLYNTPMVTYRPDGSVVLNVHDTQSSIMFSDYVAPDGCRPVSHHGNMFWRVGTPEGVRYYRPFDVPLQIAPAGHGLWSVTGELPKPQTERVYHPKRGAAVRKLLKPYVQWATVTERMGVKPSRYRRPAAHLVQGLLEAPHDPRIYLPLLEAGGDSRTVTRIAYILANVHTEVPAPYDRLPRRRT